MGRHPVGVVVSERNCGVFGKITSGDTQNEPSVFTAKIEMP